MQIYNKEQFFNTMMQYRFFEIEKAFYVNDSIDNQIIQINNPSVSSNLPRFSGSSYISLSEEQYGDGVHSSSLIAKFGSEYYFAVNYEPYDLYTISGTSITSYEIAGSATTATQLLRIYRNFILFPSSITASCDWLIYKTWTHYTELTFSVSFDKSKYDHLYTTNFTYYNNTLTSGTLTSAVYDKMVEEGLSPLSTSSYIQAYAHNYFIPESVHENKMFINGLILYNEDKEPMVVSTFRYPIVLPNNTGITFIPRIVW